MVEFFSTLIWPLFEVCGAVEQPGGAEMRLAASPKLTAAWNSPSAATI